jgi:hypothetical protein
MFLVKKLKEGNLEEWESGKIGKREGWNDLHEIKKTPHLLIVNFPLLLKERGSWISLKCFMGNSRQEV